MTDIPPFDEYSSCPKCGHRRSPEVKCLATYHDGEADGRGNACDLGGAAEHFHRQCLRCSYQWAEACLPDVPPLSVSEIAQVRDLLAKVME